MKWSVIHNKKQCLIADMYTHILNFIAAVSLLADIRINPSQFD